MEIVFQWACFRVGVLGNKKADKSAKYPLYIFFLHLRIADYITIDTRKTLTTYTKEIPIDKALENNENTKLIN